MKSNAPIILVTAILLLSGCLGRTAWCEDKPASSALFDADQKRAAEAFKDSAANKSGRPVYVISIFGSAEGPGFVHRAMPQYPFVARKRGQEGKVVLKLFIDEHGRLKDTEVVEATDRLFADAALEAVRQSTFSPAHNNKTPVPSIAVVPVNFKLTPAPEEREKP